MPSYDHLESQLVLESQDFIVRHASSSDSDLAQALDLISGLLAELDRAHGIKARPVRSTVTLNSLGYSGRHLSEQALSQLSTDADAAGFSVVPDLENKTLVFLGEFSDLWAADKLVVELTENTYLEDADGEPDGDLRSLVGEVQTVFADR